MKTEHTPGPLTVTKSKHGIDGGHRVVAEVGSGRGDRALILHTPGDSEADHVDADAERLALCWNSHDALVAALQGILTRYTGLVNCGDCGNWDPETEPEVIAARAALAQAGQQEGGEA